MKNKFLLIFIGCFLTSNIMTVDSTPTVSRVRGDQFTPAVTLTQPLGPVGVLDSTFNASGTLPGSMNINAQLTTGSARAMQVLSDGSFFIAATKIGNISNLGKYNAQGALDPSFSGDGIYNFTISQAIARAIMIDVQGRILVAGGDNSGSAGWLQRVDADGSSATAFATTTDWRYIAVLAEQTSGQIMAAGSNGSNAQIIRYKLDGTVDPAFGVLGKIILDGSTSGLLPLPTVADGLYNVVVDSSNNIYIAYKTSGGLAQVARFTAVGLLDATFGTDGIASISYLDAATSSLSMAMDLNNNLVIGAQLTNSIGVTSIASSAGGAASPVFSDISVTSSSNTLTIQNLVTTSDGVVGKIYLLGSNIGSPVIKNRVTRLTNQGVLDTTFNADDTPGYNEFRVGTPDTAATLLSGAVSPLGQVYVAGYQQTGPTVTGYVSRLYNDENTYQVSQSPETQEQGIRDQVFGQLYESFGPPLLETYSGVVTPFSGIYRGALQQKAKDVIELDSGNMLLAMDGYSDSQAQSNMILVQLTNQGVLYGGFGTGGKVVLPNITGTNEHITSMLQDGSGNLYITGYSDNGLIFRKYNSAATVLLWNADILTPGYQAHGVGLEGTNRAVLFAQTNATTGLITGYVVETGDVDDTFHALGSAPGYILSTDYAGSVLNLGPVLGGIVNESGDFYIAYKDNVSDEVNVAGIFNAGGSVISGFGVNGIVKDVFPTFGTTVATANIHLAFNEDGNVIVVASSGSTIGVALLNLSDGSLNGDFNGGAVLYFSVLGATSINLNKVTGVSDNTLIITGYDVGTDDTMLIARVTAAGALDPTFNSQSITPGVCTIQIGDQIPEFFSRVATSLMIQSKVTENQGNLVLSAYEQQFSSDSTPMVMRVFGEPGTTEVKASPVIVTVPGDFDPSYDGTGKAVTYADGASSPTSGQQVKAIRELVGTNIMTIISDGVDSWSTRLSSDSTLDTTYADAGSKLIVKGGGVVAEEVNGMVFDGEGNMIVFGSNTDLGGYVKRLHVSSGEAITKFGGYTGDPSTASYPSGTAYGLMTSVESVGQLHDGKIVVVGNLDGVGTVMMLSALGIPLTSFGTDGLFTSGENITSVSVTENGDLYFIAGYVDTDTIQKVRIIKTNSDGALILTYGDSGVVDAVISNIDNFSSMRSVLNADGEIVVSASFGDVSGEIAVRRYLIDGSIDTTFNSGDQLDIPFPAGYNVAVTSLIALQSGKTLIAGYQFGSTVPANDDYEYVTCVDALGNIDGSFGSQSTAGLVTFQVDTAEQQARYLWDMNIQSNGGILLCGAELPAVSESTPLTMRMFGYEDVQSVPQFPGFEPISQIPNILDYFFNGTGIGSTGVFSTLVEGGDTAVDSVGRPIVGGYTTDKRFVVAKFTRNGLLDPLFGVDGITQSNVIPSLLQGFYVTVDSLDNIYIGGMTNDYRLVLARFLSDGTIDTAFGGGVVQSAVFANLSMGGFVTTDSTGRPVVGGMSVDGKLIAARFTTTGAADTFGSSGIASVTVPSLIGGGNITTNSLDQILVGGLTSDKQLVVVRFLVTGSIDGGYGTGGIASSGVISGLTDGGSVTIDTQDNAIVGGYTTEQVFVAARFTAIGNLDNNFNATGIAYSDPVDVLISIATIHTDYLDRIVLGGPATDYDGSMSIIVARFTPLGILDLALSTSGMGTTGPISDLQYGGYLSTDKIGNVFAGGFTDVPSLIIAELYSGNQMFISNPSSLTPGQYKMFHYGNNPDIFREFLAIDFYARKNITDSIVRADTISAVNDILDDLVLLCHGEPGFNLIWSTYLKNREFTQAESDLITSYPASTIEIKAFFTLFNGRRIALAYTQS